MSNIVSLMSGAPIRHSAEVLPFVRSSQGSYLKAARAQGVYNEAEETLDHLARVEDRRHQRQMRDRADSLSVVHHLTPEAKGRALALLRVEAILQAFTDAGLDTECFDLLKCIIMNPDFHHHDAQATFEVVRRNTRKET